MSIKKNRYKTNFLAKVIFRIDFAQANLGQLKSFAKKLKKTFPVSEEEKSEEGIVNFDFTTKAFKQTSVPVISWNFLNKNHTKKLKVHPRFLFIEYLKYKDSTELLRDISIVPDFIKMFDIKTINRLGLRYINEIKIETKDFLDWDGYINDNLLGSLSFARNKKKTIARAMGQITFKEENSDINLNYGIWNPNYPNEVSEKLFILDFDSYSRFPLDTDNLNLIDIIKDHNQKIEDLFENSIKDPLRKRLKS